MFGFNTSLEGLLIPFYNNFFDCQQENHLGIGLALRPPLPLQGRNSISITTDLWFEHQPADTSRREIDTEDFNTNPTDPPHKGTLP
jgi:hypothetical protein